MEEPLVLRGDRVVLRPYRTDELDKAFGQAEEATSRVGGTLSKKAVARRIACSGRFVDGRLDLAVEVDGALSGSIEARAPEGALPPGVCELGIELVAAVRGRGVGTEAVGLLAGYLLGHGYPRVQASTDVAPTSSNIFYISSHVPVKDAANTGFFEQKLVGLFGIVDKQLQGRDYIAGEMSIADVALYPVVAGRKALLDAAPGLANVKAWSARMAARPAIAKAMAANG